MATSTAISKTSPVYFRHPIAPSLAELPGEVIVYLFSFLCVKELTCIGMTSRAFYRLSNEQSLWKRLYLKEWPATQEHSNWKQAYVYREGGFTKNVPSNALTFFKIEETLPISFLNEEILITKGNLKIFNIKTGECLLSSSDLQHCRYYYYQGTLLAFNRLCTTYLIYQVDLSRPNLQIIARNYNEECLYWKNDLFMTKMDMCLKIRKLETNDVQRTISLLDIITTAAKMDTNVHPKYRYKLTSYSLHYITLTGGTKDQQHTIIYDIEQNSIYVYEDKRYVVGDYVLQGASPYFIYDIRSGRVLSKKFDSKCCKIIGNYFLFEKFCVYKNKIVTEIYHLKNEIKLLTLDFDCKEYTLYRHWFVAVSGNCKTLVVGDLRHRDSLCKFDISHMDLSSEFQVFTNGKSVVIEEDKQKKVIFPTIDIPQEKVSTRTSISRFVRFVTHSKIDHKN